MAKKKLKKVSKEFCLVENSSCAFDALISFGIQEKETQISAGLSCAATHEKDLKFSYIKGKLAVEETWYVYVS